MATGGADEGASCGGDRGGCEECATSDLHDCSFPEGMARPRRAMPVETGAAEVNLTPYLVPHAMLRA